MPSLKPLLRRLLLTVLGFCIIILERIIAELSLKRESHAFPVLPKKSE